MADRNPNPPAGAAVAWLLQPWDVDQVCTFVGCSDRHLRELRSQGAFPEPLEMPNLRWWPADVIAWAGADFDTAVALARELDAASRRGPEAA